MTEQGHSKASAYYRALLSYVGLCMTVSGFTSFISPVPIPNPLSPLDKQRAAHPPKGIRNFRDFGGLVTADGRKRVKGGLLYRSGALHRYKGGGPDFNCIVDLRHPREIEAQPNRNVANAKTTRLRVDMLTPEEIQKLGLKGSSADLEFVFNPVNLLRARKGFSLVDCVKDIPTRIMNMGGGAERGGERGGSGSAVAQLIGLAADPANHPMTLHCREGKDRCGTMSAMLLLALGVSEADVLLDYTMSNALLYRYTMWRLFLARTAWLCVGAWDSFLLDTPAAKTIMRVDRQWLSTAIASVRAQHGGITTGYWNAMGVTPAALARLRAAVLEDVEPPCMHPLP
jgi:protein-tyrosine phosphatase